MTTTGHNFFHVLPQHQSLVREVGIDAQSVFDDPRIVAWRGLSDRENCTLDAPDADGVVVRLHVKRYTPVRSDPGPAQLEFDGLRLLENAGLPVAPLVGWGRLTDGRSFTIWRDLSGYTPGDKHVGAGQPFEPLLEPTADLAARLHDANLHHRDLYLCHFMVNVSNPTDLRLIDTARVGRMKCALTRRRWVVKDLSQFWYSTTRLPITGEQRLRWLTRYANRRGIKSVDRLRASVERKARWIGRHDARLEQKQPNRNVSIPEKRL